MEACRTTFPLLRPLAVATCAATVLLAGCTTTESDHAAQHEPIVGLPCEGCEAVFDGLPDEVASEGRIAPREYPGEPLRIEGAVTNADGSIAPGVIVYAYHTDANGNYPRDVSTRGRSVYQHGVLRGWVRTDAHGRYRFDTIRPGAYPNSTMPAHVHVHIIEPGRCTYYIDDIVFADDPRLTADALDAYTQGRGGSGMTNPLRDETGTWRVERDIILGAGIPDYPE